MISVQKAAQFFKQKLVFDFEETAEPILADRDYPPFDRVMMDGIAVSFSTYEKGIRSFPIMGIQAAGEAAKTLNDADKCYEVMTGAPLPVGCDLVIPYEHVEISKATAQIVKEFLRTKMENIHLKASDCRLGDIVLAAGVQLNGPHQGIAASMGIKAQISKSSRLLIVSTGNELIEIDETPLEHQIRRSNAYAIKKSLELNGVSDVSMDHLQDDPQMVADHFIKSTKLYDVMIYSGGVSKGKYDYLPSVWNDMGVTRHFHEVAQRPGKPLWFGTDEKNKTSIIGLPGNPVSSLVCLHRYVIGSKPMYARLSDEIVFNKDLTYFVPVKIEYRVDGSLWAIPMKVKNSGEFTALAHSDGFIELPAEKSIFSAGEAFAYWPWRSL
ncbi:MAG: molybdopterin molybdotransferase MoeA [Bdellovibrionales bacterium]|nr:molybdopterin molybdotransferase MoeA [Bdellovibrionales bacterium]